MLGTTLIHESKYRSSISDENLVSELRKCSKCKIHTRFQRPSMKKCMQHGSRFLE